MSRQTSKNKLKDLLLGNKKTDKLPINICFSDDQIPERKPGDPIVIVFTDFKKERETALENKEK